MPQAIDFDKTLGEILAEQPDVGGVLQELGFEEIDGSQTIPQLAEATGVSPAIITMGLEASGYPVEGYQPDEESAAAGKTLDDIIGAVFNNEIDGEKLPDGASASPMMAHMEVAIRRAQRDGTLPKDGAGTSAGQGGASDGADAE